MADNDSPPDRTVIATPREPTQAPATPHAAAGNHMLSIGAVISNTYRIDAFIARGGIGEVYRAFNLAADRVAAIKLIRPEFTADPTVVELFKREADILRRLRHDALVGYDGIFYDDAGRLCLAMDYVDGPSLGKLLQDGPLSPPDVRRLRDRVAAGLQAAHDERVFHRDISPDNIILPGGDIGRAKVIDFGIARDIDPSRKTVLGGTFAGKYSYASPEQLGMHGGEVGAPSDIYSLGLVLAEAASGEAIDMGMSPISVVEARRAVPDLARVPEELRAEIAAMLQPDPAHRPQSMRALVGGVAAAAAPAPAGATVRAADAAAAKAPRRSPVGAIAAVAALVVAGGAAAYLFWPADRAAGPAPGPGPSQVASAPSAPLPPPEPPRALGTPPETAPAP
ncbi:MAG: serine/threonine-protein kinase, partial [Rhodospirillales bacterium]